MNAVRILHGGICVDERNVARARLLVVQRTGVPLGPTASYLRSYLQRNGHALRVWRGRACAHVVLPEREISNLLRSHRTRGGLDGVQLNDARFRVKVQLLARSVCSAEEAPPSSSRARRTH